MIGHRGTGSGHHAIGIDSAFLRDGTLQGSIAVTAVAVDLQLINGYRKVSERKRTHATRRQIKLRAALRLRPQHVIGTSMSHWFGAGGFLLDRRLQCEYTGKPANRMIRPMAELAGKVATVVITIAAQANTKSAVV